MNKGKDYLKKLSYILNPTQKRWAYIVCLLSCIGSAFEMLGVSVIFPLVQIIVDPQEMWKNKYVQQIAGAFGVRTDGQLILLTCCGVIAAYFLKNVYLTFLSYVRIFLQNTKRVVSKDDEILYKQGISLFYAKECQ